MRLYVAGVVFDSCGEFSVEGLNTSSIWFDVGSDAGCSWDRRNGTRSLLMTDSATSSGKDLTLQNDNPGLSVYFDLGSKAV